MSRKYPCVYHENDKTPSNADRIRAMSDEELALIINRIVVCHSLKKEGYCKVCPIATAYPCDTEGILDYLRQPAEGGKQDGAD